MAEQVEPESGEAARSIRGLDTSVAHPARVYDYWLGGKDNAQARRFETTATQAGVVLIGRRPRVAAALSREHAAWHDGEHGNAAVPAGVRQSHAPAARRP